MGMSVDKGTASKSAAWKEIHKVQTNGMQPVTERLRFTPREKPQGGKTNLENCEYSLIKTKCKRDSKNKLQQKK